MRGRVSDWVLFPQRVSPLRRRVSFWMPRKKPKRHQGAAQDERFALIFAAPGPHFYGGRQLGKLGGYRKGAGGQGIGFCSITAAAELPATFGRCSYWLEARLLGWWGSSAAHVAGRRGSPPYERILRSNSSPAARANENSAILPPTSRRMTSFRDSTLANAIYKPKIPHKLRKNSMIRANFMLLTPV